MQTYYSISGQSLQDVCLQTYGDLGYICKLMQDNDIDSIDDSVGSNQAFIWDDSLVVNQLINQAFIASGIFYSTDAEYVATSDAIETEDGQFILTETGQNISTE